MKRILFSLLRCAVGTGLLCCICLAVSAVEKHALLIGVSRYPSLPANRQLEGSSNDIKLLQSTLQENGFTAAHLRVLADGIDNAMPPTRARIMDALQQLSQQVNVGDFVYIHFSGHGSQQPVLHPSGNNPESDNLDEIFLPSDIGRWDGKAGTVRNAIVDDEINQAFSAIRKRGAFVWAVFDTCHAGTMSRGAQGDQGERSREVNPLELGIPAKLWQKYVTARRGAALAPGMPKMGMLSAPGTPDLAGYVGFYAAQSDQTTPEVDTPHAPNQSQKLGLFTYNLVQTLRTYPQASYRQIGQQILNRYATQQRFFPTPLFDGKQLDAPVFGQSPQQAVRQWRLQRQNGELHIAAGLLQQFSEGALFALLPNPAAPDSEAQGYLRAEKVDSFDTLLRPLAWQGRAPVAPEAIPEGAYLRLLNPGLPSGLRIALPALPPLPAQGAGATLRKALTRLQAQAALPPSGARRHPISWLAPHANADLQLLMDNGKVCLAPQGARAHCEPKNTPVVIPVGNHAQFLADKLNDAAQKAAQAHTMVLIANRFANQDLGGKVKLQMTWQKKGSAQKTVVSDMVWPVFKAGDKLFFSVENQHSRSIDLTLLFLDSAYGITPAFPSQQDDVNRIEPQGKQEIELEITNDTKGAERLIAIFNEAQPHTPMQNYSFLAQERFSAQTRPAPETRGSDIEARLDEFFQFKQSGKETVRGHAAPGAWTKNGMRVFGWVSQ